MISTLGSKGQNGSMCEEGLDRRGPLTGHVQSTPTVNAEGNSHVDLKERMAEPRGGSRPGVYGEHEGSDAPGVQEPG